MRSWTIKEAGQTPNRYFATKIREAQVDLALTWARADGSEASLGTYRLPLAKLAREGKVRLRDDGQGYDVQVRVEDGVPWFWLNASSAATMAPYRR